MASRLSRRKMATFVADKLLAGSSIADALEPVAGYLVAARRTREQSLVIRDIEAMLAKRGIVVADVVTAYPLPDSIKDQLTTMVAATSLQLRSTVDADVLGGIRIDLPGKRYDGTLRHKLNALKAQQL